VRETFTGIKEYEDGKKALQTRADHPYAARSRDQARRRQDDGCCREPGISEQSYYRWRKEYGGMQVSQARKLKDLERENARLKKLVAEQALDKAILEEALKGKY
jgi:hypothetical protein